MNHTKIILGRPLVDAHALELSVPTIDLGEPDQRIARDGRIIEVPNADYLRMVVRAEKR